MIFYRRIIKQNMFIEICLFVIVVTQTLFLNCGANVTSQFTMDTNDTSNITPAYGYGLTPNTDIVKRNSDPIKINISSVYKPSHLNNEGKDDKISHVDLHIDKKDEYYDFDDDDDEDELEEFDLDDDNPDKSFNYDKKGNNLSIYDKMQSDFAQGNPKNSKSGTNRNNRKSKYRGRDQNMRNKGKTSERQFSNEYKIKRMLLNQEYDKTSRPVRNDSTTVTVSVGMSLFHILDTNEKMQTLSALIAIRLRWKDEYLHWNSSEYGGVDTIWVPAMHIWTPDIFINNFADDSFQDFMNTFAIITSDGIVLWMFPAVIKTYCTLDVRHFPFDQQKCDIVFISWTFNGIKVDITYNQSEHSAIYYKPKNQEWYVDKVEATRHEKVYACCVEPYPDVTFTIHMTRRSLFYIINLIFPCLLIYTVSFLGFFLPAESGEKVNLEITILLALVVFLLMVGETLPPTPDAIPALGLLFGTTMIMVSIALVMAVIVTNLYLRKDSGKRVPFIFRKIFLAKSAKMTHLREHPINSSNRKLSNNHHDNNHHHHHNDVKYSIPDIEMDNISQLSEQETAICTSRCRRRKSFMPYNVSDPELNQLMAEEWLQLAKTVDRICFWLFLFSSAAALIAIFAQIPNFNVVQ